MSTSTILLCVVVLFLAVVLVFGIVVVVALIHARPEDIPAVFKECTNVFGRMVDHAPRLNRPKREHAPADDDDENGPVLGSPSTGRR